MIGACALLTRVLVGDTQAAPQVPIIQINPEIPMSRRFTTNTGEKPDLHPSTRVQVVRTNGALSWDALAVLDFSLDAFIPIESWRAETDADRAASHRRAESFGPRW